MRLLLCSVGLAVCPVLAVCQRSVPANLSLADAVALARANNPVYRQAINDRAPAAWGVRSAWSTLLVSSVSASGGRERVRRPRPADVSHVELLTERLHGVVQLRHRAGLDDTVETFCEKFDVR